MASIGITISYIVVTLGASMLHLLPIRLIIFVLFALAAGTGITAVTAGFVKDAGWIAVLISIVRWSWLGAFGFIALAYGAWRWCALFQSSLFPYLGGDWRGTLNYNGPRGPGQKSVNLTVRHTLFGLQLILDTDESTSRTLVVQADRDEAVGRDRLYYVFLNERKEGVPNRGSAYRGLAIMRIEATGALQLIGDYFTEHRSGGSLELTLLRHTPWWKLWR